MSGGGGSYIKSLGDAATAGLISGGNPLKAYGAGLVDTFTLGARTAAMNAKTAARQNANAIDSLLNQKSPTPIAPTTTKSSNAALNALRALQVRSGRASTQLTNPGSQNTFGG